MRVEREMASNNLVVKVKRETIAACMTCPICNTLLRDATTISECLHTCKSFQTHFFLIIIVFCFPILLVFTLAHLNFYVFLPFCSSYYDLGSDYFPVFFFIWVSLVDYYSLAVMLWRSKDFQMLAFSDAKYPRFRYFSS